MKHIKIYFEHYNTPEDEYGIESAWAVTLDIGYKLDNILFYAKGYSLGDIVKVEDRNDGLFVVGLIKESGHSTIRIIFYHETDVKPTREALKVLGCDSEISDISILISVDIPVNISYSPIKEYLESGEKLEKWAYEEGCLAHEI